MKCSVLPEAEAVVYGDASAVACGNAAVYTCRCAHKYTLANTDMPTFSSPLHLPFFSLMHRHTQHATAVSFVKGEKYLSEKIKSATQV